MGACCGPSRVLGISRLQGQLACPLAATPVPEKGLLRGKRVLVFRCCPRGVRSEALGMGMDILGLHSHSRLLAPGLPGLLLWVQSGAHPPVPAALAGAGEGSGGPSLAHSWSAGGRSQFGNQSCQPHGPQTELASWGERLGVQRLSPGMCQPQRLPCRDGVSPEQGRASRAFSRGVGVMS